MKLRPILVLLLAPLLWACDDQSDFSSNPSLQLEFSTDSIFMDTLFSSVASSTYLFQVYNRNSSSLRISTIELKSGGRSGFRVNVDGQSSTHIEDIELRKRDSLYVFLEATFSQPANERPFLITDTLLFTLQSGITQAVYLGAYTRKAHFLRGQKIATDTLLSPTLPYVIYDSLTIEEGATLRLQGGTTLYFHSGAELKVRGTLIAEGTVASPITLRGDRTDNLFSYLPYDRVPGQWGGIRIYSTSHSNRLTGCDLHSALIGIKVEEGDTTQQRLTIENSRIENITGHALETTQSHITVGNTLIANAGGNCVRVTGGSVSFTHCTLANFYVWKTREQTLALYNQSQGKSYPLYQAEFLNCIITGSSRDEITGQLSYLGDTLPEGGESYLFRSSLINTTFSEKDTHYVQVIKDEYGNESFGKSQFRSIDHNLYLYDFHLSTLSTARAIGLPLSNPTYTHDIEGRERPTESPDAGCYQYTEEKEEEEK